MIMLWVQLIAIMSVLIVAGMLYIKVSMHGHRTYRYTVLLSNGDYVVGTSCESYMWAWVDAQRQAEQHKASIVENVKMSVQRGGKDGV
jgi:hypothetical protein